MNNCILGPVYRFAGKNEKEKEETMWMEVQAKMHVFFFFKLAKFILQEPQRRPSLFFPQHRLLHRTEDCIGPHQERHSSQITAWWLQDRCSSDAPEKSPWPHGWRKIMPSNWSLDGWLFLSNLKSWGIYAAYNIFLMKDPAINWLPIWWRMVLRLFTYITANPQAIPGQGRLIPIFRRRKQFRRG